VAKPGTLALTVLDIREIKALYNWGMQVWMICAFYNIHRRTLKSYINLFPDDQVPKRPSGQRKSFRSIRRRKHERVAAQPDPFEDAYLVVREHARVLLHKRTEPRPADASIRSYREAVSLLRSVCEHNGTRPRGPGLSLGTGHGRTKSPRCHRTVSAASLPPPVGAYRDRS
jgi:hypothetical protein